MKSSALTRETSPWIKWLLSTAAIGLYILAFVVLYQTMGAATATLSVIPVALLAWFWGLPAGVLAAVLSFPLNTLLLNMLGARGWDAGLRLGTLPNTLTVVIVALVVGQIGTLSERLRQSEESARQLTDAAFEALVVHDKGIIIEVNNAFCRMYNCKRSEIIGKPAAELTAPEFRQMVREKIAAGDTVPYEGLALRQDGTTFLAEVVGKPITYRGRQVRVTAIRDITESHQAKETVERQRNLLLTLVANLPHRIFYKDTQGRYVFINTTLARIFHLDSVDEAIGKTVFDYFPEDLAAEYHHDDMAVIETGQPQLNHELNAIDEHHNRVSLLTNKVPVRDNAGQVIGLVGISIDLTERNQMEAQRLELALIQNKAEFLKEFLDTVSHDLKTPLAVINTTIYLLERLTEPDMQRDKLQVIKAQTVRLGKLIEDILMMSRLETVPEFDWQPLYINDVLKTIENDFQPVAEKKHLAINLNLGDGLPHIRADDESLQRGMMNLIENALNYTPEGGTVSVHTSTQGDNVLVEISDTGIGIDMTDLPYIFDRFYRADKARGAHNGGTGLGLAIVKKIVEMHGGSIEVKSQQGVGTTFQIRLPIQ